MFSLQSWVDASEKGKTVYYPDCQLSSRVPTAIACSNEPWHPYTTERWLINCVISLRLDLFHGYLAVILIVTLALELASKNII